MPEANVVFANDFLNSLQKAKSLALVYILCGRNTATANKKNFTKSGNILIFIRFFQLTSVAYISRLYASYLIVSTQLRSKIC